eukprot:TRINITY_DN10153_c0_g3_i2.p1 TRINITY_DN10153_c0_g3~~TRINITY_DN10153_c0_g3_i2.p1  ORF type:complete len:121 (-),score=16.18 TRINITY_DN10153_c0_g3_i2:40-402(-)
MGLIQQCKHSKFKGLKIGKTRPFPLFPIHLYPVTKTVHAFLCSSVFFHISSLSLLLLSSLSQMDDSLQSTVPIPFSFQVSLFLSHSLSPSRALSLSPNRLQGISKLQLSSECNLAFSQTL